jgi:membrane associated rhomboid family serine protease
MTRQILQTKSVLWKIFAALAVSTMKRQINGSGQWVTSVAGIISEIMLCRFITPIFLHAGFVHILLNMLAQLIVSAQIEREMGSGGFFITYFAAGIFGLVNISSFTSWYLNFCRNVLGANFALVGSPSLGASGAIFGTVAVC